MRYLNTDGSAKITFLFTVLAIISANLAIVIRTFGFAILYGVPDFPLIRTVISPDAQSAI